MFSIETLLSGLQGVLLFLITLGVLVFVHEMGHFLAAKSVGVRVEEFAIGFGPKMATLMRRGGTDYTIRWLPLGGFVSMVGMQPEDVAVPDGLMSKPAWARAWVFIAGPLMNVVLAVLILCSMGMITGRPAKGPTQVVQVHPNTEAQRIGLRTGDMIVAINGVPIKDGEHLVLTIQSYPGKQIMLTVRRGAQTVTLAGTPRPDTEERNGKKVTVGRLGFEPGTARFVRVGFQESVRYGFQTMGHFFVSLQMIVERGKLKESVGGPVSMLRATGMNAKLGAAYQYGMMGQLSLSLAVFNLLPIPVLDGGHLAILLVEVLRRRRLGPEAHRVATAMGLVFIGVLFVFLMYSDVTKWVALKPLQ